MFLSIPARDRERERSSLFYFACASPSCIVRLFHHAIPHARIISLRDLIYLPLICKHAIKPDTGVFCISFRTNGSLLNSMIKACNLWTGIISMMMQPQAVHGLYESGCHGSIPKSTTSSIECACDWLPSASGSRMRAKCSCQIYRKQLPRVFKYCGCVMCAVCTCGRYEMPFI